MSAKTRHHGLIRRRRDRRNFGLEAIIAKLLAKDPAARFQTASEVSELLGQCLVYLERPTDTPPFPYEAGCGVSVGLEATPVLANRSSKPSAGSAGFSGSLARVFRGRETAEKPPAIGSLLDVLRPVPVTCRDPVAPWPFWAVGSASYSPDGTELAVAPPTASSHSVPPVARLRAIFEPGSSHVAMAYSPDGKISPPRATDRHGQRIRQP